MATVREIAKLAGVSASTVSRVLNSAISVSPSTRSKVLSAKEELENHTSRSFPKREYSVGIIMPSGPATNLIEHPSLFTIITSFIERLTAHGVKNTTLVYDENKICPDDLFATQFDGYMIIGTSEEQENILLPELAKRGIPHLLVNRYANNEHLICLNYDDEHASTSVVEYLISLGHRKIAFIGGNKNYQNTKRRLSGYQLALRKAGIAERNDYILFGEYSEAFGYQSGETIMSMKERPTAAYFASDPLAIGCMRYLSEHGLSLPKDLAIIGFGDIEACKYVSPKLSTVAQPSRDTGIAAAGTLLQMIETPTITQNQVLLKTKLIIRESSGGPII